MWALITELYTTEARTVCFPWCLQVEMVNEHTSALTGGSAVDPDFHLEVYLSADDMAGDASDIPLTVDIDTNDEQKTYSGLNGGAYVTIGLKGDTLC